MDLFDAPLPVEAVEIVLSMLATNNRNDKLMVRRQSGQCTRQTSICSPKGRQGSDLVGELNFSMYGTRGAQNCGNAKVKTGSGQ